MTDKKKDFFRENSKSIQKDGLKCEKLNSFLRYMKKMGLIQNEIKNEIINEYNKKTNDGASIEKFEVNFKMIVLLDIYFDILLNNSDKRNEIISLMIDHFYIYQNNKRSNFLINLVKKKIKKSENLILKKKFGQFLKIVKQIKSKERKSNISNIITESKVFGTDKRLFNRSIIKNKTNKNVLFKSISSSSSKKGKVNLTKDKGLIKNILQNFIKYKNKQNIIRLSPHDYSLNSNSLYSIDNVLSYGPKSCLSKRYMKTPNLLSKINFNLKKLMGRNLHPSIYLNKFDDTFNNTPYRVANYKIESNILYKKKGVLFNKYINGKENSFKNKNVTIKKGKSPNIRINNSLRKKNIRKLKTSKTNKTISQFQLTGKGFNFHESIKLINISQMSKKKRKNSSSQNKTDGKNSKRKKKKEINKVVKIEIVPGNRNKNFFNENFY